MTRSRLLGSAWVASALVVVAAAGVRRRGAGGPLLHGHGLRLRPRPRPLAVRRQGAANQGLSWKQIIGFYYPGTRLGRARGPIKVLITADKKDVVVDAGDGLRLTRLTGRKTFTLAKVRPKATRWRIMPRGSRSVVSYRAPGHGGWQKWTTFPGAAEFSAGNQPLTLLLPKHESAQYRGALRSVEKHTVNVLPLDRYVQGVVPREVPADWPAQAVRTQVVAARTYAAFERQAATSYYDICDTESCQVYGGVADEHPAANAAVKATGGRVVLYQGSRPSRSSPRATAATARPARSPTWSPSPTPTRLRWTTPTTRGPRPLTSAQIEKAWPVVSTLSNLSFTRDGLGAHFGGRVISVTLTGSLGGLPTSVKVTGDEFRVRRLGLKSTWFELAPG